MCIHGYMNVCAQPHIQKVYSCIVYVNIYVDKQLRMYVCISPYTHPWVYMYVCICEHMHVWMFLPETYETTMPVYIPHMNSLQSTMSPKTLVYAYFTLLVYAYKQIHLSLHVYSTTYIDLILLHISTKCNLNLPCYYYTWASNKYALEMPHMPHTKITQYAWMS